MSYKIPNEIILKKQLKECSEELGKALSYIEELKYKNEELVKICKDKYEKYELRKEELKQVAIQTRKEELYNNIRNLNYGLRAKNRSLKKTNDELICKLNKLNN